MSLFIGSNIEDPSSKVELPLSIFERHMGIFGSSGSGKTVLAKVIIEEASRLGIPVIAVDPQGDISSLAKLEEPRILEKHGLPIDMARDYKNKVRVNIFTPGSSKGRKIGLDPLKFPQKDAGVDSEDIVHLLDNSVRTLVKVLVRLGGLKSTHEANAFACVYSIVKAYWDKGVEVKGFNHLADLVTEDPMKLVPDIDRYMALPERRNLAKALLSLTVGAHQLIFTADEKLDIDKLIQRFENRTPINILFLKTLPTEEEKMFFLTIFITRLYEWMISQGSTSKPRLIFFIDEIAPFIPAGVVKPAPKDSLLLVLRQARKYGVICIACSQSPKDVDYKAFEQMGTYAIGRLTTKQSMDSIERIVSAGMGEAETNKIFTILPRLDRGEFLLISPEYKQGGAMLRTRWLLTKHETLTEDDIKKLKEKLASTGLIGIDKNDEILGGAKPVEEGTPTKEKVAEAKNLETEEGRASKREAVPEQKKPETSEDVLNALIARLEKIARTKFGLDFIRELVSSKKLDFELAYQQYYGETLHAMETGLGEKQEEDGKQYLVYDFKALLDNVIKETNAPPIEIDPEEIQGRFERIVLTSERSSVIERAIRGKPFLRYKH
ncbi:MAG: helicase HerA-like domain-containing protein [Promethearchaeati archaeon SRVP18_Atabeyarchaeia-1]